MLANESEFRVKVAVRVSQLQDYFSHHSLVYFHLGSTVFTTRENS